MKIKLCNVHKLAVANEGEARKPIFIPFGTWPYDDTISQTLDKPHAEGIAAELEKMIAAGEPGIPVYQGHPDVPEYAGKYPDKGAMGWVKKILVNEDGMECHVEWDRDPGKGFGWFIAVLDRRQADRRRGRQAKRDSGRADIHRPRQQSQHPRISPRQRGGVYHFHPAREGTTRKERSTNGHRSH